MHFMTNCSFLCTYFFFDLLKTVVKITQSMRVDNINFILCRQKWDFSWLFTIFRFDIKIDEYIRYDPKFRHLHRSSKVYGVLMYGRSNCICNQTIGLFFYAMVQRCVSLKGREIYHF